MNDIAAAWCRRAVATAAAAGGMLVSAAMGLPPEPTPAAAVLQLPDDGFLLGRLAASRAEPGRPLTTIRWQSPLFPEPIEFEVDAVEQIRFAKATAPAVPAGGWRVDMAGGDFVVGTLDSIDADHVVVTAAGVGGAPLRLRRAAVTRMGREGATAPVIVPGGLAGWNATGPAWREQGGRLVCDVPGTAASRDVAAPKRACFDLTLSWDERPEFEIFLAAVPGEAVGGKKGANADEYRVELTAGELLAIREGATAKFDIARTIPAGPGRLRFQAFIDQELGRLALVLPEAEAAAKAVFDETVAPRKPGVRPGFAIKLRKGSVRIDGLRVGPWVDGEPRLVTTGGLGGADSVVEAFDKAKGEFAVRTTDGVRQVPLAEVTEVSFSGTAVPPPPASMLAVFHGGTRLTGQAVEVEANAIRFACPGLADPLACEIGQLAALDAVAGGPRKDPAGRVGLLEANGGKMLGCLASPAEGKDGVAWKPCGAVAPVAIDAAGTPLRIAYGKAPSAGGKPAAGAVPKEPPPGPGQALLVLKTGDSISGSVISAGPEGLRFKTDVAPDVLVPSIAMRAVELLPLAASGIPREKFARLLVLPRMQQADPPTHVLRLMSGDYLRGKLVSLDDTTVRFNVLGTEKILSRSEVGRLIWLSVEGDTSEAEALAAVVGGLGKGGLPVRATMTSGRRLTMNATRVGGDRLEGTNGVLGPVAVDLAQCNVVELRPAATDTKAADLPYSQWKLKPAPVPRALNR